MPSSSPVPLLTPSQSQLSNLINRYGELQVKISNTSSHQEVLELLLSRERIEQELSTTVLDGLTFQKLLTIDDALLKNSEIICKIVPRQKFEEWRRIMPQKVGWWWSIDELTAEIPPLVTAISGFFALAGLSLAIYITQQINYIGIWQLVYLNVILSAFSTILIGTTFTVPGRHLWQGALNFFDVPTRHLRQIVWAVPLFCACCAVLIALWMPRIVSKKVEKAAQALQYEGRLKRAIEIYERCLEITPGNAKLYYNLATAYDDDSRFVDAANAYKVSKKIFASENNYDGAARSASGLSRICLLRNQLHEARRVASTALLSNEMEPRTRARLLKNLSWINLIISKKSTGSTKLKILDLAYKQAENSLQLSAKQGAPHCLKALILDEKKNRKKALIEWNACVAEPLKGGETEVLEEAWIARREERLTSS